MSTTKWADSGVATAASAWPANTPQAGTGITLLNSSVGTWLNNGGTAWQPEITTADTLVNARIDTVGALDNDQQLTVEYLYGAPSGSQILWLRMDATFANGYGLLVQGDNARGGLIERVDGVGTLIAGSFAFSSIPTGVWKSYSIKIVGTTLTAYYDGNLVETQTVTSRSSGVAGFSASDNDVGTAPMLYRNCVLTDESEEEEGTPIPLTSAGAILRPMGIRGL